MSRSMPPVLLALVQRYVLVFPAPWGPAGAQQDQNCRDWIYRLAQQARHELGPEYGAKATSAGGQTSKDVMARQTPGRLDGWDILFAAGGGAPTVHANASWVDLTGQVFVPVSGVNHLSPVPASGRPLPPSNWIGLTSFNLGEALERGDGEAWLQMCQAEGVTVPRVIVARMPSTLAQGLARLPLTLTKLAQYGMRAEIVLLADTQLYGLTEAQVLDHVAQCMVVISANPVGVGAIQGANEPEHSTQQTFIRNAAFMQQVESLVPRAFPFSYGPSTHGGASRPGASYLTTHGARSQSADANAAVSEDLSLDTSLEVIEDEPIGVAEVAVPGSRTNDPAYGAQLAAACQVHGLGGATLHLQAGLTCDPAEIGPVQIAALRGFVAGMGGGVPVLGDPVLDAPLTPESAGYAVWIQNWVALSEAAAEWYLRATGRVATDADIGHGLYRCLVEAPRWKTARAAFQETWPGGAPV